MTTYIKFRVYCNTEGKFVHTFSTTTPTNCPNNAGHTHNPNSISEVLRLNFPVLITSSDSPFDLVQNNDLFACDTSGGNITVNLTTAGNENNQRVLYFIKTSASNTLDVEGYGSETVGGSSKQTLTALNEILKIQSNGTNWDLGSVDSPNGDYVAKLKDHAYPKGEIGTTMAFNVDGQNDVKIDLAKITAPTVNDDSTQDYEVNSKWIDTVQLKEYLCLDNSVGSAVWKSMTTIHSPLIKNTVSQRMPVKTDDSNAGFLKDSLWIHSGYCHYPLNGNANDVSGNGRHGTAIGGATFSSYAGRNCVVLNSSGSQYIDCSTSDANNGKFLINQPFSIMMWFYTLDNGLLAYTPIGCRKDSSESQGWSIVFRDIAVDDWVFAFGQTTFVNDSIEAWFNVLDVDRENDSNWHHMALIYKGLSKYNISGSDDKGVDLYVDGKKVTILNLDVDALTVNFTYETGMALGRFGSGAVGNKNPWKNGGFTEVIIHDFEVTKNDILRHYNSGFGTTESPVVWKCVRDDPNNAEWVRI